MGFFRKAFTLVELLIAIVLFTILGSIIFYVIIKSLRTTSTEGGELKAETSIELNTDILDFDIRHIGYGISKDETSLVLSYCNGTIDNKNDACKVAQNQKIKAIYNKTLLLKETSNVVRSSIPTVGFVLWNGTDVVYAVPSNAASSTYTCVWLDVYKYLTTQQSCNKGPRGKIATGFPLDTKASCQDNTNPLCCYKQNCTGIAYYLKDASSKPKGCLKETFVFYRRIPPLSVNGSIYEIPMIDCVADWDVWFGLDTDGDTKIDKWVNELPNTDVANNTDLANKLKAIKVYLLVQASYQLDKNYNYCKIANVKCDDPDCGDDGYIKVDELNGNAVCLKHPSNENWVHYRWKIIEKTYNFFPNLETFKSNP